MTTPKTPPKQVKVTTKHKEDKGIMVFVLSFDQETITLEPGTTWSHADHYKWVMRDLIEEPQMLHVFPDGSIEINSEKILITDPTAVAKLEHQINKRHIPPPALNVATPAMPASQTASLDPRRFRVKLDHFGHLMIEWGAGIDREETGMRGLGTLIANGLIRKPGHYRVDPMQRSIEIDGVIYECNEAGAKSLEAALNTHYAPQNKGQAVPIEIKENHAASTGFDIHFRTSHAGVTHDIKGHLSQELLDQLQDPNKSNLIQAGIHLFLSPPNLLIRRRRPDMGEEKIPELPDVSLHHLTAVQLQQIFNHPLICRSGANPAVNAPATSGIPTTTLGELRVVRHPEDKRFLWLECIATSGESQGTKALSHHNISDLQQAGCFQPHLEVSLSLDHLHLTIRDRRSNREDSLTLDPVQSPDEALGEASHRLTQALKSCAFGTGDALSAGDVTVAASDWKPQEVAVRASSSLMPSPEEPLPTIGDTLPRAAEPPPPLDPTIAALFHEADALRVNQEVFRHLGLYLGITPQEVHLSLPFVFDNRRFEVLNFERQEITSLMELRGTDFYGFYLSYINERKIVLDYACNGMHVEWGPDKCVLQATVKSEVEEYPGSVLLGLAQDPKNEFVFVVRPDFKKWIAPREMPYTDENLQFLTVADIASAPAHYTLIWPRRPT